MSKVYLKKIKAGVSCKNCYFEKKHARECLSGCTVINVFDNRKDYIFIKITKEQYVSIKYKGGKMNTKDLVLIINMASYESELVPGNIYKVCSEHEKGILVYYDYIDSVGRIKNQKSLVLPSQFIQVSKYDILKQILKEKK